MVFIQQDPAEKPIRREGEVHLREEQTASAPPSASISLEIRRPEAQRRRREQLKEGPEGRVGVKSINRQYV